MLRHKLSTHKDQFFTVITARRDYLGERYFRFNAEVEKVVQVCVSPGDVKKGKSNNFGVYLIHRTTFHANYFAMGYVKSCTKETFDKNFEKVVKMLR